MTKQEYIFNLARESIKVLKWGRKKQLQRGITLIVIHFVSRYDLDSGFRPALTKLFPRRGRRISRRNLSYVRSGHNSCLSTRRHAVVLCEIKLYVFESKPISPSCQDLYLPRAHKDHLVFSHCPRVDMLGPSDNHRSLTRCATGQA